MAHYKRKRPRTSSSGHYSGKGLEYRLGIDAREVSWLANWPRYWDKIFHIRPARARTHQLERGVILGDDPDNMVWPDGRKPHIYFW